ncbi:MAG: HAMP domain-containing histidine kinase, partial [Spirochaetia bacterium]|nr:HAMP domain-containing histidine kinase [Spirochaetia bacterium]
VLLPIALWWAFYAAAVLPRTPLIQPEEPSFPIRILLIVGVQLIFLLQLAFVATANFWYEKLHQERKRQMETSSKMALLGEMAGKIAHEINNPLAIIQAYSLRIRKELEDPDIAREKIAERLDMVDLTVEKMAAIVRSLLVYSKTSNRNHFAAAELKNIIDNVVALSRLKREEYGVQLKIAEIPDLALECRDIEIMQVLLNLILNSCEAVRHLGERWIEIEIIPGISQLTIRVTDSGRGIPDEVARKMMQPFFSTKEAGQGTGLGLSLSKGMIEAHDGQLDYDPTDSHTRFSVKIPYRQLTHITTPSTRSSS